MPVFSLLHSLLPDTPIKAFELTESTNTVARTWLKEGAAVGSLVIAARQSSGRGRMGRSFVSAAGGLYMSILLPNGYSSGEITTLCAVAVHRAVEQLTGKSLAIKWVNDLLLNGKKVCGILCEGVWLGDTSLGMVAGIGLNVCQESFPEALQSIAGALYPNGKAEVALEVLAAAVYKQLFTLLLHIPAHMDEYRTHCITLGQTVRFEQNGQVQEGRAEAIADDGALFIQTAQGRCRLLAGEVTIRTIDGALRA